MIEPLAAFLVATALSSALYWIGQAVPFVHANLHGALAVIFLYAPALAARMSGRRFDYRAAGLRIDPLRLNLRITASALALTWPCFFLSFLAFYGMVCASTAPLLQVWANLFAPLCPGWTGLDGASLRLPPDFALLAASQLVVVAIPEELFFRGYLWARFEERWPSRRRFMDALVGRPLIVTSLLFALGHVLVDFDPARIVVFFPALVFGWMRARTGSIAPGAVFHALCNLLSEVLHTTFFR